LRATTGAELQSTEDVEGGASQRSRKKKDERRNKIRGEICSDFMSTQHSISEIQVGEVGRSQVPAHPVPKGPDKCEAKPDPHFMAHRISLAIATFVLTL
jgi:hypothetical protein